MKHPISRSFAGIASFMLVVSMACNLSSGSPTSGPQPTSVTGTGPSTLGAPATDTPQAASTAQVASTPQVAPTTTAGNPAPTASAPAGASAGGGCANAYYPVASGDSWSYASNTTTPDGTPASSYTYTTTITAVSDKGFTTSTQASTGADTTVGWNCQGGNLAVLDVGGVTSTTSKIKLNFNAVSADGYNIPATFDTGTTWSETITATATITASAGRTVNSQIASQSNCTAAGAEKISLPVGNFDTVKATCIKTVVVSVVVQGKVMPVSTIQESVTDWYAKSVGLVKSVAMIGTVDPTNSQATPTPSAIQTVELSRYSTNH